jgi:hypothetical protein
MSGQYRNLRTDPKRRREIDRILLVDRARDGDPDRPECGVFGETEIPVDEYFERSLTDRDEEAPGVSAPLSATYFHPDPDRRALVDAWLEEHV